MYKYKGEQVRKGVDITPTNESRLMQELQKSIDSQMSKMTLERGRELLQEDGVMIFLGWDISFVIIFYSFVRGQDTNMKMNAKCVDRIYTGSGLNPDDKSFLTWALYP